MDYLKSLLSLNNITEFLKDKGIEFNEKDSKTIDSIFKSADKYDAKGNKIKGGDGFLNDTEFGMFMQQIDKKLASASSSVQEFKSESDRIKEAVQQSYQESGVDADLVQKLGKEKYNPYTTFTSQVNDKNGNYKGKEYKVEFKGTTLTVSISKDKNGNPVDNPDTKTVDLNSFVQITDDRYNLNDKQKNSLKAQILATLQKIPGEVLHDMISETKGLFIRSIGPDGEYDPNNETVTVDLPKNWKRERDPNGRYDLNKNDELREVITHEIGHAVHYNKVSEATKADGTNGLEDAFSKSNAFEHYRESYGMHNYKEYFANAYAETMLGKTSLYNDELDLRRGKGVTNLRASYKQFQETLLANRAEDTRMRDLDAVIAKREAEAMEEENKKVKQEVYDTLMPRDAGKSITYNALKDSHDNPAVAIDTIVADKSNPKAIIVTDKNGKKYRITYDEPVTVKKTHDNDFGFDAYTVSFKKDNIFATGQVTEIE